jgi:hypothetical protein
MATFSINPLGVGTNMSSSGQKTILPYLVNNTFICVHIFEHIATPFRPLSSCQ